MKCAGCLKPTKDLNTVKCTSTGCAKSFCALCINVSNMSAERKKVWKCPDCCAAHKKGGDNSHTPAKASCDNLTTRKKTESTGSDISQLTETLRVLTAEISSVKTKLNDLTQSLAFNNDKMEDLMQKWTTVDARLKSLEKRDNVVENLQITVLQLQNELNSQTQLQLRNEIEIVGIPENSVENLHHTILVAAKKIGVELDDRDIDWVTRVGPRRPPVSTALPEDGAILPRPVVVRLIRRSKRDQFLRATKSRKSINSSDLEISGVPRKVFFNERLTKENRILFRECRTKAKENGYSFCWCSQGTFFVRQREGKAAVPIRSHKDLDCLRPTTAVNSS